MRVQAIPIKDLTVSMKESWSKIQFSNPDLSGPSFHHKLFIEVSKINPKAYVSVISINNRITGFIPFLLDWRSFIARPIEFCYYQFILTSQHQPCEIDKVLRKSNLKSWEFVALANYKNITSRISQIEKSNVPCVNLKLGFENYLDAPRRKSIGYDKLMYKHRLLEKQIGPVRFVPFCNEINVLQTILPWKIMRYKRDFKWVMDGTELMERIYYLPKDDFSGFLSALYAGDKLLAATFNLRFQRIMQFFIASFDQEFSRYSPGSILLYYLVSELHKFQCNILDLGEGSEQYKYNLANDLLPILKGSFRVNTFKEKIKSNAWLYNTLYPIILTRRNILKRIKH